MDVHCPLPEVAEALRPYIRPRQEVDAVRQVLQAKFGFDRVHILLRNTKADDRQSSPSNTHTAYLKALQANQEAQSRYGALKLEVDNLSIEDWPDATRSTSEAGFLKDSYLPLLKQREKQRRLAVLERAFTNIDTIGGDIVVESFENVVKKEIGDLPLPPSSSALPERELNPQAGPDFTNLKKAIIGAKQKYDSHQRTIAETGRTPHSDMTPQAELQALQSTQRALTDWMEAQLAMISDVEGPDASGNSTPTTSETVSNGMHHQDEIESLYEQYLDARERLLQTVLRPSTAAVRDPDAVHLQKREGDHREAEQRLSSDLSLTYLSKLIAAKRLDQDLLLHSSQTRRQLSSAESYSQALLDRLADESHIVSPSLSRRAATGKDWTDAASTSSASTNEFTMQRLKAGEMFARSAGQAFAAVKTIPYSLDTLIEQ